MSIKRKNILTIAGFDPSGGAGILADVKTFEQHKLQSFAVQTANTIQTESQFIEPNWIPFDIVQHQMTELLSSYQFDYVKIGLIRNFEELQRLIQILTKFNPDVRIIWDPVLSATADFNFAQSINSEQIQHILHNVFICTPNWDEVQTLSGEQDALKAASILEKNSNSGIYLKGGHNVDQPGRDYLFFEGTTYPFKPMGKRVTPKHGSGCIFSSALASNLAKGYPLIKSCLRAKTYVTRVLESSDGLLGYHKF